jgi:hypothetical protein
MFNVYEFNNVIQRYRIQKCNVVLYWLLKKLGKKTSRPQFKQWTMRKVVVDQLYPTIGPFLSLEYQDESGDDGDKGTTKKLGQLNTMVLGLSSTSDGHGVVNLSYIPNPKATSLVAYLFPNIFWFLIYFQIRSYKILLF